MLFLFLLIPALAQAFEPETLLQAFTPKSVPEIDRSGFTSLYNPFSALKVSVKKDEFQSDGYSFGLKIKPKGLFEASDYHKFGSLLNQGSGLAERIMRSQSLLAAYTLLVQADLAKEQEMLQREMRKVVERGQKLSAIEARKSRLDAKGLLKADMEIEKARNELAQGVAGISELRWQLSEKGLRLEDLDSQDMFTPEEISRELTKIPESTETLSALKSRSDIEIANLGFELKKTQNRRWLDEVELFTKEGKGESRIGFEVSINLPFLAAKDLDEQKDQIKLVETKLESERLQELERVKIPRLVQVLKEKIEVYRFLQANSALEKAAPSLSIPDAGFLLELNRTVLQKKLNRSTLLAEIRMLYLELMHETGRLAENSNVNVLSRSQRRIF